MTLRSAMSIIFRVSNFHQSIAQVVTSLEAMDSILILILLKSEQKGVYYTISAPNILCLCLTVNYFKCLKKGISYAIHIFRVNIVLNVWCWRDLWCYLSKRGSLTSSNKTGSSLHLLNLIWIFMLNHDQDYCGIFIFYIYNVVPRFYLINVLYFVRHDVR